MDIEYLQNILKMRKTSVKIELLFLVLVQICFEGTSCLDTSTLKFAQGFSFGVATSAYQVEGAWNVSGKGISFWDYITHNTNAIVDGSNGDIACNSYYKTDEDVALLKELGVQHYRFSIAWTRILPTGMKDDINWEGVAYYDQLITKLIEAEIQPWVTIYHDDHPYSIHVLGGWFQPKIADYLTDYADILFELFGDKVKTWITINEPYSICVNGVDELDSLVPTGIAEYLCGQNVLKAHASVWDLYNKKYRAMQKGKLSMAFNLQAYLPATDKIEDIEAAERLNQFSFGWFVHPLVFGNYPPGMIETVAYYSQEQGFKQSRLPDMSLADLIKMKGAYDFIGLNHYDTFLVSANNGTITKIPSYQNDYGAEIVAPEWNTTYSIDMRAKGFGVVLNWIKNTYNDPEIRITEQGYPEDKSDLADIYRHSFIVANMAKLLHVIFVDKINVTAYTFWSFVDNFEWTKGYTKKYGLNYVDFDNPERPRTPRISSLTFSLVATQKSLHGLV